VQQKVPESYKVQYFAARERRSPDPDSLWNYAQEESAEDYTNWGGCSEYHTWHAQFEVPVDEGVPNFELEDKNDEYNS
jgi:hypothetical protein